MYGEKARILVLLAVVLGSTMCAPYEDFPEDASSLTFSCGGEWCNETWKGDRILCYNLSVYYEERTENQSQHSGPVLNCSGSQISTECVQEGSGTELTPIFEEVVNRTLVSIKSVGHENLLFTDNFNNSTGSLEGSYRENQDKIWQIKIPHGCQLWIIFEDFDLEVTRDCEKDYFSVQTSKSQPDIRKYCRSLESITVQYRRRVQLWFHADDTVQRRGIHAQYCFRQIRENSSQLTCDCNQKESHSKQQQQQQQRRRQSKTSEEYAPLTPLTEFDQSLEEHDMLDQRATHLNTGGHTVSPTPTTQQPHWRTFSQQQQNRNRKRLLHNN